MLTHKFSFNTTDTALLVVDPQKAFGAAVEVPEVEPALVHMRQMVGCSRQRLSGNRIIFTKHVYSDPAEVGRIVDFIPPIYETLNQTSPLAEFYDGLYEEGDLVVAKTRFNACLGTGLIAQLREWGIRTVLVCGLTTPICVQTTVDALMMADFQVVVIDDACASQPTASLSAQEAHWAAIERMRYLFAQIMSTQEAIHHLNISAPDFP